MDWVADAIVKSVFGDFLTYSAEMGRRHFACSGNAMNDCAHENMKPENGLILQP
jgi:hypothetical protein